MNRCTEGCLLCGEKLVYEARSTRSVCALCGQGAEGTARCAAGHFVCDGCHRASALEVIERVALASERTEPLALATELMQSPALAMHGPEHHFLVAAVLLATFDKALGRDARRADDLAEARRRAERVPGGFCGTHGNCGAGVGAGIFWSVATGATPLTDESWSQANRLTAHCLLRIADHGGPRCCKRDTWHAVLETREQIGRRVPETGWSAPATTPRCSHQERNRQCLGARCVFHPEHVPASAEPGGLAVAGPARG
jgi:hypothetical protein